MLPKEKASELAAANLVALTADVASAYLSQNQVQAGDVPALIDGVYSAFARLGAPGAAEPVRLEPPVPIKKTVSPDAIISLEDGKPYRTLRRHLSSRGLTPGQYREKWGLPFDYPMVAANYASARSELAKSLGLGRTRRDAAPKVVEPDTTIEAKAKHRRAKPEA